MKKTILGFVLSILVILLLLFMSSCSSKPTVKIGLLTDITGRASLLGISARNALELAVEEYNQGNYTYKVQLIIKDDKGLEELMKQSVAELINEDAQIIIGPFTSNIATEIFKTKMNESNDILFISPTVSSSTIVGVDDNFITLLDKNEEQGIMLAKKAYDNGLKKMATIYEYNNRSYSKPLVEAFEKEFINLGGDIVYTNKFTTSEDAPFLTIANDIVESGAEGALIVAGGLDASQLTQYIHKNYPNIEIYCGMWAKTLDFISNGGTAVEGTYLAGLSEGSSENEAYINFSNAYYEKYNSDITFPAVCTYEAAQLLFSAMEEVNITNLNNLRKAILESDYNGLSNDLILDNYGDSNRPYVLYKVKEGKYIRVTE